jgi:hypothetical protein
MLPRQQFQMDQLVGEPGRRRLIGRILEQGGLPLDATVRINALDSAPGSAMETILTAEKNSLRSNMYDFGTGKGGRPDPQVSRSPGYKDLGFRGLSTAFYRAQADEREAFELGPSAFKDSRSFARARQQMVDRMFQRHVRNDLRRPYPGFESFEAEVRRDIADEKRKK